MIRGSCACGAVRFELSQPPGMMGACHCSRCRKTGVGVFVFVRRETFRWVCGEAEVAHFEPSPPFTHRRAFCRHCGSAIGEPDLTQESFPLAASAFDDDPVVRIRFHEFVADKPAWYEIRDGAKQFEGHPVASAPVMV